jgi:SSS family solute:Na+ symporter
MSVLQGWDWLIILAYFLGVAAVAWWSSRKQNTSTDYFLAGRDIGWFAVGASLFSSNIGSEHLVGLAGAGASSGVAMAHYELHAWCILVLGWVLVPFYYRSGVFTMPEFLERRYNATARWILSIVSLTAYVFTKVSVTVYAGGMVFGGLFPDFSLFGVNSFWIGAVGCVVITGIYTVTGGLRAVVYTDAMQTVVLIIGSL